MGFRVLTVLTLTALGCAGQTVPAHHLVVTLPYGSNPDGVIIRYVLAGQDFGGWAQRVGDSLVIDTMTGAAPATAIKAVAYIPGCAIEKLDIRLSGAGEEQNSIPCRSLGTTSIAGKILQSDLLSRRGLNLQAFYIARWAHDWLGLTDASVLAIPVGAPAVLNPDGAFRISVPDLANDAIARDGGELEIWAMDQVSHERLGQLIVRNPPAVGARMGGLRINNEYPSETFFTICGFSPGPVHDREGFAQRGSDINACDRPGMPGVN